MVKPHFFPYLRKCVFSIWALASGVPSILEQILMQGLTPLKERGAPVPHKCGQLEGKTWIIMGHNPEKFFGSGSGTKSGIVFAQAPV